MQECCAVTPTVARVLLVAALVPARTPARRLYMPRRRGRPRGGDGLVSPHSTDAEEQREARGTGTKRSGRREELEWQVQKVPPFLWELLVFDKLFCGICTLDLTKCS
jgi:hypothetical protein